MSASIAVKAGEAFVEVSLRSKIREGARRVQSQLSAVSASFSTVGSGIAAVGASATAAFGGIMAALSWPTKMAADMEQVSIQFEVMTGSAAAAQAMLTDIRDFAAKTPFEFAGLSKAASTLLSFGISNEKIMPTLRALGDVSGGSQEKLDRLAIAFGQVQSKGKLMAGEVNQMVENGFNPLQEISRTTGKPMEELFKIMEAGGISAAMVEQAFKSVTSEGGNFFGMMDKQAQTLTGRMGALWDAVKKAVTPIGEVIATSLKPLVEIATAVVGPIGAFIANNKQLAATIAMVATAGAGIGVALLGIGGTIIGVGGAIGGLGALFPAVVAGFTAVTTAIAPALPAIAAVGAALVSAGAAIAGVVYIANQAGILGPIFEGVSATLGELSATVTTTFGGILTALSSGEYSKAVGIMWAGIKLAFLQGAQAALGAFSWLFENGLSMAAAFGKSLLETIWNLAKAIPQLIASALTGGAMSLSDVVSKALTQGLSGALDDYIGKAQSDLSKLTAADSKPSQPGKEAVAAGSGGGSNAAIVIGEEESQKAIQSRIDALRDETMEAKLGADAFDLLKLKMQGATAEQLNEVRALQMQRDAIKARAKANEDAEAKAKELADRGRQLTEEVRTPFQVFADKIRELDQLTAAGAISQQTYNAQVALARDQLNAPTREAMQTGRNTIAEFNTQESLDVILRTQRSFDDGGKNRLESLAEEQTGYLRTLAEESQRGGGRSITVNVKRI